MSKHFSLIIIKYTTFTLQLIEYKSLWNNRKYILFTNTTMQIIHTQQSCTCTRFIRGTCLNWQIRYIFIKKKVVWPCSHLNNIEETLIPISGQTTNINLWGFFSQEISNCYYLCSIFFNQYFQLSFPLYRNTNCRNVHFL